VVRRHVPPSYIKGFPVPSSFSLVNSTPIELPPFMVVYLPLQLVLSFISISYFYYITNHLHLLKRPNNKKSIPHPF